MHIRVLLVEDNPGDATLITEFIAEAAGDSVDLTHVIRFSEGIAKLEEGGFDAILLDMSLPDSHGVDTVRKMNEAFPRIPIVVMTGLSEQTAAVNAVEVGAQDYLVKGHVEGEQILKALHEAIERHRLMSNLSNLTQRMEKEKERMRDMRQGND